MISESLVHLGEKKSGIRELFEYGLRQAAVVGKENVYDYSLGNPSVPAPEEVASIIRELLEGDSLALHGYTPAGGAKEAQQAVADDLTQRSGDTIRPENIFFTCGAAPALVAVLRALAIEDAEFVAIAPYFPEYQVFVSYNGGKFVEVPPDTKNFQVDIAAVERALTPHTQAVLVNSPNNPSGVIYSRETLTALGACSSARARNTATRSISLPTSPIVSWSMTMPKSRISPASTAIPSSAILTPSRCPCPASASATSASPTA